MLQMILVWRRRKEAAAEGGGSPGCVHGLRISKQSPVPYLTRTEPPETRHPWRIRASTDIHVRGFLDLVWDC